MFWAIDLDDFDGNFCNQGKYPLINTVHDTIQNAPEPVESENVQDHINDISSAEKRVVCYYASWSYLRFPPENIDPFLCSHIIFAFAQVYENKIFPYDLGHVDTPTKIG